METIETSSARPGRVGGGMSLIKSAWRTLKLDKELVWLELLGVIVSVAALAVLAVAGYFIATAALGVEFSSRTEGGTRLSTPLFIAAYLVVGTTMAFIANLFAGAIIIGATERFKGGDPTVSGSINAVWRHWQPLLLFGLMMTTVGLVLQLIEERVPLAGRIAVWLVGAAWNIANIFAVPVIVLKEGIGSNPLNATRESVGIIRKVWGEGVVAHIGLGLVTMLTMVIYFLLAGAAVAAAGALTGSGAIFGAVLFLAVAGFMALVLVFTTLGSIVKAALYHLAVTGETPPLFDRAALESAITKKKPGILSRS